MNDLISRRDAKSKKVYSHERHEYVIPVAELDWLPSVQPEQRWIPVEDEPPKEKKTYWVCTDTGYQCECRWTNNVYGFRDLDEWGWSIFDIPQYTKVVAYMPLPEPWKGEEE